MFVSAVSDFLVGARFDCLVGRLAGLLAVCFVVVVGSGSGAKTMRVAVVKFLHVYPSPFAKVLKCLGCPSNPKMDGFPTRNTQGAWQGNGSPHLVVPRDGQLSPWLAGYFVGLAHYLVLRGLLRPTMEIIQHEDNNVCYHVMTYSSSTMIVLRFLSHKSFQKQVLHPSFLFYHSKNCLNCLLYPATQLTRSWQ